MFRNVPECSGMFHVPGFIDAQKESEMIHFSSRENVAVTCSNKIKWETVICNFSLEANHKCSF